MSNRRPSAALIVAALALFVAVSGTGYALSLPHHSVGTPQLKKNAVTGAKVKDGSLSSRDFNGPAPTGAFFAHADGPVPVSGSVVTVESLDLPAGGYSLEGSLTAQNQTASGAKIYCKVGTGPATRSPAQSRVLFLQPFAVDASSTLPLTDDFFVKLSSPATITFSCLLDVPVGSVQTIDVYDINLVGYYANVL